MLVEPQKLTSLRPLAAQGRWKAVGRLLEGCWKAVGRLLEGCWKAVGRPLEGRWKAVGRPLEAVGGRWRPLEAVGGRWKAVKKSVVAAHDYIVGRRPLDVVRHSPASGKGPQAIRSSRVARPLCSIAGRVQQRTTHGSQTARTTKLAICSQIVLTW